MSVDVFLPCRAGSERVPRKNTRTFAGREGGLLAIKLEQLLAAARVDQIVLSTNDEEVIAIGASLGDPRIRIDRRPEALCTSSTSTDELITYVPTVCDAEHILWTHVTSPFLDAPRYDEAIERYLSSLDEHDSLMSVARLQTFLWTRDGALNYDRAQERWPRTQTLEPVFEVDSGIFLHSRAGYLSRGDRIGDRPILFETSHLESIDIDWEDDFALAESIYRARSAA